MAWSVLIVVAALGLGGCNSPSPKHATFETSRLAPPPSPSRALFDDALRSAELVPYTKYGTVLARLPPISNAWGMQCNLSSDGKYLAVTLPNYVDPSKAVLKVFDMDDGTVATEIHAIPSHALFLVPDDVMWGPTDAEFFVFIKYSDVEENEAGGDWIGYDVLNHKFTADGQKRLDYLDSISNDRSDGMSRHATEFQTPGWDYQGKSYASEREQEESGKAEWIPPTFSGHDWTALGVDRTQFDILVDWGSGDVLGGEGRDGYQTDAYVVSNGNFLEKLELATNHVPQGALLYNEQSDLVMVFISVDPGDDANPPWRKIRFTKQHLEQMNVTQTYGDRIGVEQRILLLLKSSEGETLYLLRTRLG